MSIFKYCIKFYSIFACLCIMTGCHSTNYYTTYFNQNNEIEYVSTKKQPILMEYLGEWQKNQLLEKGYVEIGYSLFNSTYTPRAFIIECAKEKGAEIVLCRTNYERTEKGSYIDYVPTMNTSYTHGNVYAGYPGYGAYGSYNATTTTYGSQPIVRNYSMAFYDHYAWFFSKRKYTNNFGVYFSLPTNTPGKKSKIYIQSVIPESIAAKNGLKKGQIVKTINGKKVINKNDLSPYLTGEKEILSIEVED